MKPYIANIINGLALVILGLWGYFGSETPSTTALIPVAFGVIFLILTPWLKKENKIVAHIIVVLTLLVLISLIMPLRGAIGREDTAAIIRVGIMMITGILAMISFIQSFIAARRARVNT